LLFGVVPAWRSSRADPQDAMRADSRSATTGREGVRVRSLLISLEVGLCTACLIVGALLLQSFTHLLGVQRGFDVDNVLTVDLAAPASRYPGVPQRTAFLKSAIDRMTTVPSVTSVGLSNMLPLTGEGPGMALFVDGVNEAQAQRPTARIRAVNAEYFR